MIVIGDVRVIIVIIRPFLQRQRSHDRAAGKRVTGHRVSVYAVTPGSGRVSGQTICVFRPDAVTRFPVEQQTSECEPDIPVTTDKGASFVADNENCQKLQLKCICY